MSKYQVGDLVRVSREKCAATHNLVYGTVAVVVRDGGWCGVAGPVAERVLVEAPDGARQSVSTIQLKPAKQAMRKRAQYSARRGGDPFEIPHSVQ